MRVPFLDLEAHHDPIRAEIMARIEEVVSASAFAGGSYVAGFERDYAAFCGTEDCIGVGSGTEALWLILRALDIGPGDEVITTPMTFMATAEAITCAGATPVFADIDPVTYTLDPANVEAAITPRSRAIVPVHLFGQCADMDGIRSVAARHGLAVIEDAAQAHGATYRGRPAGSLGIAAATSFYPGKNLGAWGEAGAITTSDATLAARLRMLRDHGQSRKYHHEVCGWNARMDGIQAVVLQVKLRRLRQANEHRRRAAARYHALLADTPAVVPPVAAEHAEHVYHVYAVRVGERDEILERLSRRGIACGIHYPVPVHLQPAYAHLGYKRGDFPVSERCAETFLSLPLFPEISDEQTEYVASALKAAVGSGRAGVSRTTDDEATAFGPERPSAS